MATRTNEYCSTLYNTPAEATLASADDWLTACGNETVEDTKELLKDSFEFLVDELHTLCGKGDWGIPNIPSPTKEDIEGLFKKWLSVN